jgi:hypothetical protein
MLNSKLLVIEVATNTICPSRIQSEAHRTTEQAAARTQPRY